MLMDEFPGRRSQAWAPRSFCSSRLATGEYAASLDCQEETSKPREIARSLHGEGADLIAGDFYFDAVGRAGIESAYDGAAHQDVAGELLELQGIKDGVAAGIHNHGVLGLESVIGRKLREVIEVLELALTERRCQGKCPVGFAFGRRPRQANNERGNVLRQRQTPEEESLGRPRLR